MIVTAYSIPRSQQLVPYMQDLQSNRSPTSLHTLELKVSLRWNRLTTLESLLASPSERLRHTRSLRSLTRQSTFADDDFGEWNGAHDTDEDDDEDEKRDDNEPFRIYTPCKWASSALNALIRLLISKLPPQQLKLFR